jgi:hypothetical protein
MLCCLHNSQIVHNFSIDLVVTTGFKTLFVGIRKSNRIPASRREQFLYTPEDEPTDYFVTLHFRVAPYSIFCTAQSTKYLIT